MRRVVLAAAWLTWAAASASDLPPPELARTTTDKAFETVVADLEFAITERNFRITGRNEIGAALRERGADDAPDSLVLLFCNLTYAQEALRLDPALIALMPCRIAVYETGDRVVISTLMLPEDARDARVGAFARKVNTMLREIMRFAVKPW